MKSHLVILLSFLFFAGCKSKQKLAVIPTDFVEFSIKKGGCFGTCPIYIMNIYGGGKAVFTGENHTEKIGTYSKQLGDLEYQALREKFSETNLWQYLDEYPSQVPDLPLIVLKYRDKKGEKSISGKEDRPEAIVQLQTILENIANSTSWTFEQNLDGQTAKEIESLIKSEIIIEPSQGTLLPHFFDKMKKAYGMRIINRINSTDDLWLVTYNTNKITGDDLLAILRNDSAVKSAEFNKKITPRGEK